MNQKLGMTSSQTIAGRSRPQRVATRRILSGHAALLLGVSSITIFLISAIVSFGFSYDQWTGRQKLTLMLIGLLLPLVLAVLVRKRIETTLGIMGVGLALVAPIIGLAGLAWKGVDLGSAAGSLAVLVPLAGCGIVWAMARQYRALLVAQILCLAVAVVAIVLSGEHSAILGLLVGVALGALLLWRFRIAEPSPGLRVLDSVLVALVVTFGVLYLLLILVPERLGPVGALLPDYYRQRFAVWREAPALISDYLYTGSGLGNSAMVLSSYLFVVHVPFLYHIHNLFLQIAIEQGILGLIGIIGMFVAAFWSMAIAMRRAHAYVAVCAACVFASLLSLWVSGMFESDIYAGAWVVTLFLSFGFAWVISQYDVSGRAGPQRFSSKLRRSDFVIGAIPFLAVVFVILWPGARIQWLANQAAVAQTKAELTQYIWPLWPVQDALRRSPKIDLDTSIAGYRSVLAQDPMNITALRRLGQIQLSRGEYQGAYHDLLAAYQLAPQQRATRQLLGEVYAVQGDVDAAVDLWRTVDNTPQQLQTRSWWYQNIGETDAAQRLDEVYRLATQP